MRPSESNNSKTPEHDDMHLWLCDVENQEALIKYVMNKDPRFEEMKKNHKNPYDPHNIGDERFDYPNMLMEKTICFGIDTNIIKLDIEVPVYTGYNSSYLQGICDGLLKFQIKRTRITQSFKIIHNNEGQGSIKPNTSPRVFCEACHRNYLLEGLNEDEAQKKSYYHATFDIVHEPEVITKKYIHNNEYPYTYGILIEFKPKLTSVSGVIGQIKTYIDSFHKTVIKKDFLFPILITYDENKKYDQILINSGIHILRIQPIDEIKRQKEFENLVVLGHQLEE